MLEESISIVIYYWIGKNLDDCQDYRHLQTYTINSREFFELQNYFLDKGYFIMIKKNILFNEYTVYVDTKRFTQR